MIRLARVLLASFLFAIVFTMEACNGGSSAGGGSTPPPTTPSVAVTPASTSITTTQTLSVTIAVSASSGTPSGSVVLSSGSYTSSTTMLSSGTATITIPAGSLSAGTDTLTAKYTPDSVSSSAYDSASGTASVIVTQATTAVTPTLTVTPASATVTTALSLAVTVGVSGTNGTPTGSVVLSSGSYTSSAVALSSGTASITIPAGSLAVGSDLLNATYTPDSASSSAYLSASGSATVTVISIATTNITVDINTLGNRHAISPFVYGLNVSGAQNVADLNLPFARWGGNQTSNYNWKLHTYNSGGDYYFENFLISSSNGNDGDSVQWITDVQNGGAHALTTMPTMAWVAAQEENGSNGMWSFSVAKFGPQCSVDPYNKDAGNGQQTDCKTPVTTSAVTSAYYPLVDTAGECPSGTSDGSACIDRQTWAQALASAFGSGTCSVPYSTIASCHFYDMDNEPDSWPGSHKDVHPQGTGYNELANLFESEASALKSSDPAAVRFGPVVSSWWFYWNMSNSTTDSKGTHANVDFLPWWLNQIKWLDEINGSRTLDVFDVHAYPDAPSTSGYTTAQKQALAASVYRDYWDPTYDNGADDAPWATSVEPNYGKPFRIPRLKALVNAVYPGTPLSFTEWSASFVSESDFSTALGDANAYGAMGREGLSFASRWGGPSKGNPNYLALKLYTNYDGARDGFGTLSVADSNNGNPSLFTSYAALNQSGMAMTIMVINSDPTNTATVTFSLNGFSPASYVAYTLSSTSSSAISASTSTGWTATQSFAPYSITLLSITGNENPQPASEWSLNPDDLMIPASGTATLHPVLTSGAANVTLSSAVFDAYEGAPACSGSLTLTHAKITPTQPATITVDTGSTQGFCHYTVTGDDGTVTQTQGGWIIVGNPAATLTQSGNNQSGSAGTALSLPLAVTLNPGQSGASATGAGILFTTSAGTLSDGTTSGSSVIAQTNSSGVASVTLTLPATKGAVTVTAQDQFALGGATVTFTESAN